MPLMMKFSLVEMSLRQFLPKYITSVLQLQFTRDSGPLEITRELWPLDMNDRYTVITTTHSAIRSHYSTNSRIME